MTALLGILSFFGAALPFLKEVYDEYLSANAKQQAAQDAAVARNAAFLQACQSVLARRLAAAPAQSVAAGNAWDAANAASPPNPPPSSL